MNRRQVLKYSVLLTGSALCAPLTAGLLADFSNPMSQNNASAAKANTLHFFKASELQTLGQIMDAILPKTDSPSATEVGSHLMMDQIFGLVFKRDYTTKFMQLFAKLDEHLSAQNFSQLSSAQQAQVLQILETKDKQSEAYWAYVDIKQQTIAYYLSSEQVAENFLNYLPIPGEYKPCVPLAELGGKAWAI